MCPEKGDWDKVIEFHGHSCPGVATGYHVAMVALQKLQAIRAGDEELVAIVENDSCGVDAIQVLTGCTFGKGNLIFNDLGKQVYTFACRNSGRAVRVAVKGSVRSQDPSFEELRDKVYGGTASEQERKAFHDHQQSRIRYILDLPDDEFCEIWEIKIEFPAKASIYDSYNCAKCGEQVMEPRARVKGGMIVCLPCSE
ncbi:MAG: FmdE family protein [Desulfotomaculaceae bacterium]|nr:FmdE family protein [Desulfotomaculaceae bacterium]